MNNQPNELKTLVSKILTSVKNEKYSIALDALLNSYMNVSVWICEEAKTTEEKLDVLSKVCNALDIARIFLMKDIPIKNETIQ